jgi:glyoxylase-like metal-dependent hydrolase (beta-lactamase superfamily II)
MMKTSEEQSGPSPEVEAFFDPATGTVSYVVHRGPGSACALVDTVLDYDAKAGRVSEAGALRIATFVREHQLRVEWILETHAHADHLSAASFLRGQFGGRIAIGAAIRQVQEVFAKLFNLEASVPADGSQFDHLFGDGEDFAIGDLKARALHVPGHTPADMAYLIGNSLFVGDTLFMPDVGTARCDFPGGSARTLYASIRKLLALPPRTRLFVCHDYPPAGRAPRWETSVAEERAANIHAREGIDAEAFVSMREARDATLDVPGLILPALQVNIRAGALPEPESNGRRYLKIPLNSL